MRTLALAQAVALLGVAIGTGCSTDREGVLIGKWKGDEMSSTFAAIKLKEDSGASLEDAQNAAKMMAATYVDLRKDKTYTAGMSGMTLEGNWTFNKETGEVVLNNTKLEAPGQQVPPAAIPAWTAYLDENDRRLSLYPAPPESVAMIRGSKTPGSLSGGISLFKR